MVADENLPSVSSSTGLELETRHVQRAKFKSTVRNLVYEYASNTSIHGLQYLAHKRHRSEKYFWIVVFLFSTYLLSCLISEIYVKWMTTPVIVSFSEKSTPVYQIPFPAVTICSETKRTKRDPDDINFGDFLQSIRFEEKERIERLLAVKNTTQIEEILTLLQICQPHAIPEGLQSLFDTDIEYFDVLDRMAPPFNRLYNHCKRNMHFMNCNELLTKTYTEEGICYTFNGLNSTDLYRENTVQYSIDLVRNPHFELNTASLMRRENLKWTMETGYARNDDIHTYPARVLGSGSRAGFFVALESLKSELDYDCRGPVQGFKVLLHAPNDAPQVSKHYVRVSMDKEISIIVKPSLILTSEGVSKYSTKYRNCFLAHERTLRFFKIYTQSNCELECLSNYTYNKCGCVMFSMPRTPYMSVCNEERIHCVYKASEEILLEEFNMNMFATNSEKNKDQKNRCNCLPTCTSLSYNTEISHATFHMQDLLKSYDVQALFHTKLDNLQISRLSIYFKDNQFISMQRSELYGITNFLANCGGIFGLFMGFSIMSLVEIIYYATLRLWHNLHIN